MNDLTLSAKVLQANIAKLDAKSQTFAESLLTRLDAGKGLSEKQWYWVGQLADRATKPPAPQPEALPVGDVGAIVAMITGAKAKLKWPRILLHTEIGTLRVSLAGNKSKVPGSVNVTDNIKNHEGRFGWIGRIGTDGAFVPGLNTTGDKLRYVLAALIEFANDPAGVAKAYGVKTGHCCFCSRELTDKVSVGLGYGPICAQHYGLPHTLTCE